jgi:hypothetical protein
MKFSLIRAIGVIAWILIFRLVGMAQTTGFYHQLSAEEFDGIPELTNDGNIIAYTNCYIDFNYRAKSEKGIYHLTCDVKLVFNKDKSWINKKRVYSATMMEEVLKHEQGHYFIAFMEQQELIRTINKTRFDANYQYEASNMFDRIHEKYKQLSLDYDDDTAHMQNKEQQHSWDAYFKRRMEYMPPTQLVRN